MIHLQRELLATANDSCHMSRDIVWLSGWGLSFATSMSTYSLPPIQSNYSSAFPHPNQPAFLPQSLADQSLDPNSPDVFKQNIQLVQQHVARVNSLARNALNGMLVIIESSRQGTLLNSYTESVHIMLGPHPHRQKVCLPNSP